MLTVEQAAAKWGVTAIRVRQYLQAGRVPRAKKVGRIWVIPSNAAKPKLLRVWRSPT